MAARQHVVSGYCVASFCKAGVIRTPALAFKSGLRSRRGTDFIDMVGFAVELDLTLLLFRWVSHQERTAARATGR